MSHDGNESEVNPEAAKVLTLPKGRPTPKAPQNRPKISPEQQAQIDRMNDASTQIMRVLEGMKIPEAVGVLKACGDRIQNTIQGRINEMEVPSIANDSG